MSKFDRFINTVDNSPEAIVELALTLPEAHLAAFYDVLRDAHDAFVARDEDEPLITSVTRTGEAVAASVLTDPDFEIFAVYVGDTVTAGLASGSRLSFGALSILDLGQMIALIDHHRLGSPSSAVWLHDECECDE